MGFHHQQPSDVVVLGKQNRVLHGIRNSCVLDPPLASPQSSFISEKVKLSALMLEVLVHAHCLLTLQDPKMFCLVAKIDLLI